MRTEHGIFYSIASNFRLILTLQIVVHLPPHDVHRCTELLKIDPQHLEAIRKMGLHIITWTLVVNPTLHLFWRWMMKLLIISLLKLVSATNGQVMRNFVVLFAVSLNKLLNRKPSYRWFETPRGWWCWTITWCSIQPFDSFLQRPHCGDMVLRLSSSSGFAVIIGA